MKHLFTKFYLIFALIISLTSCEEKEGDKDNQPGADQTACILKSMTGAGANINIQYKTNGQIETISHTTEGITINPTYNSNNNIIKLETKEGSNIHATRTYTLNGKNVVRLDYMQVTEEVNPDGTTKKGNSISRDEFTYSGANMSPDRSTNFWLDPDGSYKEIGYTNYFYDARGNLIKVEVFRKSPFSPDPAIFSNRSTYTYDEKSASPVLAIALDYEFPMVNNKNNLLSEKHERMNNDTPPQLVLDHQSSFTHSYNDKGFPSSTVTGGRTYNFSYDCK